MRTFIFFFMLLRPIAPAYSQGPGAEAPVMVLQERFRVFYGPGEKGVSAPQGQLIERIASLAGTLNFLHVDVDGHADRSGTREANMQLARDRADAVVAELTRLGIGSAAICVNAHGADEPMIAKGQSKWNRRVEISVYGIPRL